jgi:hypothetical protein
MPSARVLILAVTGRYPQAAGISTVIQGPFDQIKIVIPNGPEATLAPQR